MRKYFSIGFILSLVLLSLTVYAAPAPTLNSKGRIEVDSSVLVDTDDHIALKDYIDARSDELSVLGNIYLGDLDSIADKLASMNHTPAGYSPPHLTRYCG